MTRRYTIYPRKPPTSVEWASFSERFGCREISKLVTDHFEYNNGGVPISSKIDVAGMTIFLQSLFPLTCNRFRNVFSLSDSGRMPVIGWYDDGRNLLLNPVCGTLRIYSNEVLISDFFDPISFPAEMVEEDPVTALISKGDTAELMAFLQKGGTVHCLNKDGESLTQLAAMEGDPEMLKICLENGGSSNEAREVLSDLGLVDYIRYFEVNGVL